MQSQTVFRALSPTSYGKPALLALQAVLMIVVTTDAVIVMTIATATMRCKFRLPSLRTQWHILRFSGDVI